jgi:chromatin remodeling complex protein RSC6
MSSSTAAASTAAKSTGRKTKTTTAAPAAAAAPAPAPVPVAAPAPAPVAAPAPVNTVATTEAHTEEVNVAARVSAAVEKVNALRSAVAAIHSELKILEKQVPKELKKAAKGRRARKAEGDADKPKKETVFNRPTPISDALAQFLGVAKGTQIPRCEVTSRVCAYAREKGLMDKQVIKADAPLRKLLSLKESDELKILNLQRYLKPHYPKAATA